MADKLTGKGRIAAIWALRIVLGLLFLAIGTTKLTGTEGTVEYFAAIGWGQWFRYLTGLVDVVGALLLFLPRRTFYGAAALLCTVGTATLLSVTLLRNNPTWGSPENVAVPLTL